MGSWAHTRNCSEQLLVELSCSQGWESSPKTKRTDESRAKDVKMLGRKVDPQLCLGTAPSLSLIRELRISYFKSS